MMTNKNIPSKTDIVMRFIFNNWPFLKPLVPESALPFNKGFGIGEGLCTHPGISDKLWFRSDGFHQFSEAEIVPQFMCIGCQNRGGSEYFFMMWHRDGRKYWFYDQYAVLVGSGFPASVERTEERLLASLKRWDNTTENVLFSGVSDRFVDNDGNPVT